MQANINNDIIDKAQIKIIFRTNFQIFFALIITYAIKKFSANKIILPKRISNKLEKTFASLI
jgi:hypothetical protein